MRGQEVLFALPGSGLRICCWYQVWLEMVPREAPSPSFSKPYSRTLEGVKHTEGLFPWDIHPQCRQGFPPSGSGARGAVKGTGGDSSVCERNRDITMEVPQPRVAPPRLPFEVPFQG